MKYKKVLKEIAEGVLLGVMILGTLIVSVKINAATNPEDTLLKRIMTQCINYVGSLLFCAFAIMRERRNLK